eukprot:9753698-Alexandrium_andersonii.AAC.1
MLSKPAGAQCQVRALQLTPPLGERLLRPSTIPAIVSSTCVADVCVEPGPLEPTLANILALSA